METSFESLQMDFSVSTHWNAYRHGTGEEMLEEILSLGISRVELGYDLRHELVPGVQSMAASGAISVGSVHNFCPIPVGAHMGHPELFTFGDPDPRVRDQAIWHTRRTAEFAAELGAKVMVVHMGNVKMKSFSRDLIHLAMDGLQMDRKYEKRKFKMLAVRDRRAPKQLDNIRRCLEAILPALEETGVTLAMENLPTWEAFPTETEAETLIAAFDSPFIRYWHDIGHGQIRENLGLTHHLRWLERLRPVLAGYHVHDVVAPAMDHAVPPDGMVDFPAFRELVQGDVERVFEPSRRVSPEALAAAITIVREAWTPVEEEPSVA